MTTAALLDSLQPAMIRRIGEPRYRLWFDGKTRLRPDRGGLTIGVPNRFYQEWLQKSFNEEVLASAREVLGPEAGVRYEIDPELFRSHREQQAEGAAAKAGVLAPPATSLPAPPPAPKTSRRRWLELDDFVVGPANRFAHAAALNLIEHPDAMPIPLTLHGPPGTGKTHLLEGVHQALCRRWSLGEDQVLYVTAEEFTNRFLHGLQARQSGLFRKQFREARALLLDDFHFLSGKQSTQREFLYTFETLHRLGRPVAVACETHPRMIPALLPELADRLVAGGVWPLAIPDRTHRGEILRRKAEQLGCSLPEDGIEFLADELHGNVRELVGALHAIQHYQRVQRGPISLELIRSALGDLLKHTHQALQLADIENALAAVLELPKKVFHSKDTARTASYPRMLAVYVARRHTHLPYREIGRYFGGRSHAAAIAAEKKVKEWLAQNTPLILGSRRWQVPDLLEAVARELGAGGA